MQILILKRRVTESASEMHLLLPEAFWKPSGNKITLWDGIFVTRQITLLGGIADAQ